MKNSVLPIYHLALIRGFALAHAAPAEIQESLEALYNSAVKGEAIERLHSEGLEIQLDLPDTIKIHEHWNDGELGKETTPSGMEKKFNIPEKYKLGDNIKILMEADDSATIGRVTDVLEKNGGLIAAIELANPDPAPVVNMDLSIEAAKRQFPHFTEMLDQEFSPIADIPEAAPTSEIVNDEEGFPTIALPEGMQENSRWPARFLWFLYLERAKGTNYLEIAAKIGKHRPACEMRYSNLLKSGDAAKMRAFLQENYKLTDTAPGADVAPEADEKPENSRISVASRHSSGYAGKRDDKTLVDSDWPDIRHRYHGLYHSAETIGRDYGVSKESMEKFIRLNDAKEAELARDRLGENKAPGF